MFDADMVSDLIKHPSGAIATRVRVEPEALSVSVIVAAELRYGAAKRAAPRLAADVERVLAAINIEPLAPPVDEVYGALRSRLEAEGRPMSANDLLIAAHALSLGRRLVTRDKAFSRVPGLLVEDWTDTDHLS